MLGPRGTGKSSWIKKHFPKTGRYIDLLNEETFFNHAQEPGLLLRQLSSLAPNSWVVIDEIQSLPSLLNGVHSAIENQKLKFVLSGSSARNLRKKGVNLLGGRALELHMHPFISSEIGNFFNLEAQLQFGSIPIVFSSEEKKKRLLAYVQIYLSQEIQRESAAKRLPSFVRFLSVASLFNGQIMSLSSAARDSGVARSTIQSYLEILVDSLMIFFVEPYRPKLRVKEVGHPKLYWFDTGVVRAIKKNLGPVIPEEGGSLFESWVAQLLRAENSYREIYDELFFWSSHESTDQKVEVDFLLKRGQKFIAIEAKYSERLKPDMLKGLKAINELKNIKEKILVYRGKEKITTPDGIKILPVPDFLKYLANL